MDASSGQGLCGGVVVPPPKTVDSLGACHMHDPVSVSEAYGAIMILLRCSFWFAASNVVECHQQWAGVDRGLMVGIWIDVAQTRSW